MTEYEISLSVVDKIEKKHFKDFNILCKDSICKSEEELKCYLLYHKKLENKCHKCNLEPKWNGKPLDFVIDRKNNKKNDNRIENLQFLCPNCFYQKSRKSIYEDVKNSKMGTCIDCNKRFKRKKEKTSLNPVGDIIEKQVKHKYTKMRCNFCLEKNIISEDRLVENDKTINNNVVIVI